MTQDERIQLRIQKAAELAMNKLERLESLIKKEYIYNSGFADDKITEDNFDWETLEFLARIEDLKEKLREYEMGIA